MSSARLRSIVNPATLNGQIIGGTVTPAVSKAFHEAMASNGPVFELEALEGNFLVALGKVVYVKRSARETQIGFGSTS